MAARTDESKVIIVTGASRGIGHAIARHLLSLPGSHRLVLSARTSGPLVTLQSEAPDRVAIVPGDVADAEYLQTVVETAVCTFGRLDALVLNHGTLGAVKRVADADVEGWVDTFRVNFFSCVAAVKVALHELRKTKGRIIMTSSGAAQNAYSTWGAYGSSKAAMNHLALTLKTEEPDVTTVAIRPGVVDSEMQREIREVHHESMDDKDRLKFLGAKTEGKLLRPEQPGNVIANLAVGAGNDLSGQFLSWDDKSLADFQS